MTRRRLLGRPRPPEGMIAAKEYARRRGVPYSQVLSWLGTARLPFDEYTKVAGQYFVYPGAEPRPAKDRSGQAARRQICANT